MIVLGLIRDLHQKNQIDTKKLLTIMTKQFKQILKMIWLGITKVIDSLDQSIQINSKNAYAFENKGKNKQKIKGFALIIQIVNMLLHQLKESIKIFLFMLNL
ncbi:unnamed protein product [Paramecium sonneborni]|uniref:Uncharacterized protein n=1 Tax=Paramecium sonneborni TaxID=65129 RepID=A0A8S1R766_9CILI|nr:unnamed protein product [Paramecium sonneborni]